MRSRANDPEGEVARLQALGATALAEQPADAVIVLRDPEGNEFCLLRPDSVDGPEEGR